MEMFLFTIVGILMVGGGICTFLYTRTGFKLVRDLEKCAPKVWENLGCPQIIYVKSNGEGGGMHTIKPLLPYLSWLISGDPGDLRYDMKPLYKTTRMLFMASAVSMVVVIASILLLIAVAG